VYDLQNMIGFHIAHVTAAVFIDKFFH